MNFVDIIIMLVGEPTNYYETIVIWIMASALAVLFIGSVIDLFKLIAGLNNNYGRR